MVLGDFPGMAWMGKPESSVSGKVCSINFESPDNELCLRAMFTHFLVEHGLSIYIE